MHEIGPFAIPEMRNFVPEKLRPWIVIMFAVIFQLSGGVYLAVVSEMVGSTALMQEDVMMAGYASMVGMALTFTVMFRLKFRYSSKLSLIICAVAIIVGNTICARTLSVPLLVGVSFVTGFFRMWGTFICNSTIQLWITPKRDLSVFFCYIYLLVQGCIQLTGIVTVQTAHYAMWEYMHYLIIGLLSLLIIATLVLYTSRRVLPKLPLYGIDWLGALLWAESVLCVIFVCTYGEFYDWWHSPYVCLATAAAVASIALNLWRASFIRHPFINIATLRYPVVGITFGLYLIIDLLLAPSHLFEHMYMEAVLDYDAPNLISLNWVVLGGIICGAFFTWRTFAVRKWRYQTMTVVAFAAISAYLMIFYFTIDYNLPKEMLVLPLFLRGFGYVIIAITFITALARVPFQHFFQTLSVQAFVSAGIGGALGSAVLGRALRYVMTKNAMLLGAGIDAVNPAATHLSLGEVMGAVGQQALMVSMKELYGVLAIWSLVCLLLFALRESDIRPRMVLHPTYAAIRRLISREVQTEREAQNAEV